jgi:hypothetical protein
VQGRTRHVRVDPGGRTGVVDIVAHTIDVEGGETRAKQGNRNVRVDHGGIQTSARRTDLLDVGRVVRAQGGGVGERDVVLEKTRDHEAGQRTDLT